MELPYLTALALRLNQGLKSLPVERIDRHRSFIWSKFEPSGGFGGREPGADLYYTGFAVRSLLILDGFDDIDRRGRLDRLADFLDLQKTRTLSVVDLLSWLYSALVVQSVGARATVDLDARPASVKSSSTDRVGDQTTVADLLAAALERFRTKDGGYAKTDEGAVGSTYHSFLVALCYQLVDRPTPHPEKLVDFINRRRRDDGGFVEIDPMKRSGTNPTAAAVALLRMFKALDDETIESVADYLESVRSSEGGFQANTRIPFADGLSTFTGALTAFDMGRADLVNVDRVRRFVASLELPAGGFKGADWDQSPDVEYTFYSLGTLGLIGAR
jgi:geranylgeranyl transferase type-2 subunit beta